MVARNLKTQRRVAGQRGFVAQQRKGRGWAAIDRQNRIADMQRRLDRRDGIVVNIAAQAGDDQTGTALGHRREGRAI